MFDKSASDIKTFINDTLTVEADAAIAAKANQSTTYTKTEVDSIATGKANQATTYTKTEVDNSLATKQKSITSGTAAPSGGSDGDIYLQYE